MSLAFAQGTGSSFTEKARRDWNTGRFTIGRIPKESPRVATVASPFTGSILLLGCLWDGAIYYSCTFACFTTRFEALCFHGCLTCVWIGAFCIFFVTVLQFWCNLSPWLSHVAYLDKKQDPLKAGDIVKIDLGCHIDGYIAVAAHTVIVKEAPDAEPVADEELGNVAVAAYNAMLVAAASITAGKTNTDVTKAVERVAASYGVNPISSVRMHQVKRYVLDGVKEVALKEPIPDDPEDEKVPDCTFEQAEVYAVDVAMSSGDGKARPGELRTTVFKRNVEKQYLLKVKASRQTLAEVDKKYPTLPFTLRHLSDIRAARLGINECIAHGLLTPYPSLHDYSGKVAHFKCTVLLLPSGTSRVTGLSLPSYFKTEKEPDEETKKILEEIAAAEAKKAAKKAKRKNKKKK